MAAARHEQATQKALQSVAQGTRWTYSLLWQLCPNQGALVWAEGHYNGAIKTRKTVRPGGDDDEDDDEQRQEAAPGMQSGGGGGSISRAARRRSTQLRELYDSLAREAAASVAVGGGGGGASSSTTTSNSARRPCASLAPEDLADTEWFYLMCASYCFPPGVGLPGKAFATRRHVWLTGANQVDSKVFLRAILARSAGIQTVACIPVADGVLEIGTTEKVEEDIGLIQRARSIFMDQHGSHQTVPTVSGHSTSSPPVTYIDSSSSLLQQMRRERYSGDAQPPRNLNPEEDHHRGSSEIEDDDEEEDDVPLDIEIEQAAPNNPAVGSSCQLAVVHGEEEVSDDRPTRYGCSSSYMDGPETANVQMSCQQENTSNAQLVASLEGQQNGQWDLLYENLFSGYLDPSAAAEDQAAVPPENAHYAETVLRILRYNVGRQTASSSGIKTHLTLSTSSSFARWRNTKRPAVGFDDEGVTSTVSAELCTPQRMLKAVLFNAGSSSSSRLLSNASRYCREVVESPDEPSSCRDGGGEGTTSRGARRGQTNQTQTPAEVSASHVIKERRRREKLNERFVVLRSLVPFVTKMDRASILGDTIEYLKQLRRRIQDLESSRSSRHHHQMIVDGVNNKTTTTLSLPPPAAAATTSPEETRGYLTTRRSSTGTGVRATMEASQFSCSNSSSSSSSSTGMPPAGTEVQVSIIESDALLELRCPHRDGLLLRLMHAMHRDLRLEVTSVQASSTGGVLLAELRAKVKNEIHGRRSSIAEVKRAIHMILSSD